MRVSFSEHFLWGSEHFGSRTASSPAAVSPAPCWVLQPLWSCTPATRFCSWPPASLPISCQTSRGVPSSLPASCLTSSIIQSLLLAFIEVSPVWAVSGLCSCAAPPVWSSPCLASRSASSFGPVSWFSPDLLSVAPGCPLEVSGSTSVLPPGCPPEVYSSVIVLLPACPRPLVPMLFSPQAVHPRFWLCLVFLCLIKILLNYTIPAIHVCLWVLHFFMSFAQMSDKMNPTINSMPNYNSKVNI